MMIKTKLNFNIIRTYFLMTILFTISMLRKKARIVFEASKLLFWRDKTQFVFLAPQNSWSSVTCQRVNNYCLHRVSTKSTVCIRELDRVSTKSTVCIREMDSLHFQARTSGRYMVQNRRMWAWLDFWIFTDVLTY